MTTKIQKLKDKQAKAFDALKDTLHLKNVMQAPKISKAVVSVGVGSTKDKKKIELIADRLKKITGQKPSPRTAKKSVAGFKSRQGDLVGYQVTLRGSRMWAFLDKFLNVSIPRTRDFRGISKKAIDDIGNITIGIREHTIFPETAEEELKDVFGLAITVATTAKDKKQAESLFTYLGFPFAKDAAVGKK
jgi:large subunit ribosomal protein L5